MKITKSRLKEIIREELLTEKKEDKINYKAIPEAIVDYIVDGLDSKKVTKHFTKWDFPKDAIKFNDKHITTYGNKTNIAVSTPVGMKDLEIIVKLKR